VLSQAFARLHAWPMRAEHTGPHTFVPAGVPPQPSEYVVVLQVEAARELSGVQLPKH
jgi:hypothetical protein